jgi:von Willebrand factor type A domain
MTRWTIAVVLSVVLSTPCVAEDHRLDGDLALDWLASRLREDTSPPRTGVTLWALGLAGETFKRGRHRSAVREALRALMRAQETDGSFAEVAAGGFVRDHAMVTLGLMAQYEATGSPICTRPAREALGHLDALRLPGGVWPATIGGTEADLEATAWAVLACRVASRSGREEFERDHREVVLRYLDGLGKDLPLTDAATALALRLWHGVNLKKDEAFRAAAAAMFRRPEWARDAMDARAYFFAARIKDWRGGVDTGLWDWTTRGRARDLQCPTGDLAGSFDPAKGRDRISTTALYAMGLECHRTRYIGLCSMHRGDQYFGGKSAADEPPDINLEPDAGKAREEASGIHAGRLPTADPARIADWIDLYAAKDPAPTDCDLKAYVEAMRCPWGNADQCLVRIGLRARKRPEAMPRPIRVTLVVDTSRSMGRPRRLPEIRNAILGAVEDLGENTQVAIVAFGDEARVILPHTGVAAAITMAIRSLEARGETSTQAGLEAGIALAAKRFAKGGINRVVLCCDETSPVLYDRVRGLLATKDGCIELWAFGFGVGDFTNTDTEKLAEIGGGTYRRIGRRASARRLVSWSLTGEGEVRNGPASIRIGARKEHARSWRVLGREARGIELLGEDLDLRLELVRYGYAATVLLQMDLRDSAEGQGLADVEVEYPLIVSRRRSRRSGRVLGVYQRMLETPPSRDFRRTALAAWFARVLHAGASGEDLPRIEEGLVALLAEDSGDASTADLLELIRATRKVKR